MSFFSQFSNVATNLLFGSGDAANPNKVREVKIAEYTCYPGHCREEGLIVYGPLVNAGYEIVLQRPFTESTTVALSVFRGTQEEAEMKFLTLKDKLPIIMELQTDYMTVDKIQQICDKLSEHPTWSVAHLIAFFGMSGCLKHEKVKRVIGQQAPIEGVTPLHVALESKNIKIAKEILAEGVPLDLADASGNTVFHLAACASKEFINLLAAYQSPGINARNNDGYTPLHLACLSDKPDCVKALLQAGADVNIPTATDECFPIHTAMSVSSAACVQEIVQMYPNQLHVKDMKNGGTPLHWATTKPVLEALISHNCNINALNFNGETALHVMVERDRLPCVIVLLSHGIDVNTPTKEGQTALHMAIKKGLIPIAQALIVFGADLSALNSDQETPRHMVASHSYPNKDKILYILHAAGAKRCTRENVPCGDGCRPGGRFEGVPLAENVVGRGREVFDDMLDMAAINNGPSLGREGARLLCLDGGGIRGLVLIQILLELEAEMRVPILHCFDWVSGTSTGGILALALASGKTVAECQGLYFRLKDSVFVGIRPYPTKPLEDFLCKEMGETATMASITHPKVFVTGVLADRNPADLHLFRNYPSPQAILGIADDRRFRVQDPPEDQLIWKAARASGAAPSYFRASGCYIDGGLIANNPTLDTITEIHEYNMALKATNQSDAVEKIRVVVSVGTGRPPLTAIEAIDVFRPESLWDTARLAMGVSALGRLLVDQAANSDNRVVDRARAWCSMIDVPYFRLSPVLSQDVDLAETKDDVLVNMLWETKAYLHRKRQELRALGKILLRE